LEKFKVLPGFLGAKSCGALGADTILIFTRTESVEEALQRLGREGFRALRGDTVSGLKVKNDL